MDDRDYELLSAYIDNALNATERAALEKRLAAEPALRQELRALQQTVRLLRELPTLQAPRSFTLSADQLLSQPRRVSVLPFPLTATFSALSAAAAVMLFVFGGYFLLRANLTLSPALPIGQPPPAQVAVQPSPEPAATILSLPTQATLPTQPPTPAADMMLSAPPAANADTLQDLAPQAKETTQTEEAETAGVLAFGEPAATDGERQMQQDSLPVAPGGAALSAAVTASPALESGSDQTLFSMTAPMMETATAETMAEPETLRAAPATATAAEAQPAAEAAPMMEPVGLAQDALGAILLMAGVLLLGLALITTYLRRRNLAL
jgi:hypothetical protein